MYKGLAHLCNLRLIPTRATFRRIAYVWPLVYVNSCTSDPEPHYAAVSRLLEFAGVEKDSRQLKKAFLSVREKYPEILEWLKLATRVLQEVASFVPNSGNRDLRS
jgi:hypothetical protein